MTNCVSAVNNSIRYNVCSDRESTLNKQEKLDSSVFAEPKKYTVDEANALVIERLNKKRSVENSDNNSCISVFKRIFRGAYNGIKNTFSFAFDSPPMTMAAGTMLLATACSSRAMFVLTLAALGGAVIGGALLGVTQEFNKSNS